MQFNNIPMRNDGERENTGIRLRNFYSVGKLICACAHTHARERNYEIASTITLN